MDQPTAGGLLENGFYLGPSNISSSVDLSNNHTSNRDGADLNTPSASNGAPLQDGDGPREHVPSSLQTPSKLFVEDVSNHWIALGSIRLHANQIDDGITWSMKSSDASEPWPNATLELAERRGWIQIQRLPHSTRSDRALLRIHVFPEDVGRAARGSVKDFRKLIKYLLPFIDASVAAWNGHFQDDCATIRSYAIPRSSQEEALFYIFNTLESPKPDISDFKGSSYARNAIDDVVSDNILGLKTKLYAYQKRSVAVMLQREEDPRFSQDPRKPLYTDLQGKQFYLDVFDGAVLQEPQLYEEPRGGILAETMGYGKTLACLALILATRGHYPRIPEGRVDRQASRRYPSTPSLLAMAARGLRQAGLPWKAEFEALKMQGEHYDTCIEELQKYHREFAEPIFNPTTPDRKASKREAERTLRLCYATLLIVPPNLLVQWQHETQKHTEPGSLDLLVLDSATKTIPDWRELMNYDVILISKARFEQEYRDDDLNQARRLPGQERYKSPFTDLRWLRVICDEGHAFAGSASRTNSMVMLNKMSIERVWSISGTPSTSLHGVEVNLASVDDIPGSRSDSVSRALEQRRLPITAEQETKDMERLRLIVTHFLKVQPWANPKGADAASWKKYLSPFDGNGKRRCAPGLRTLLQSLMVRHRISDIDVDLQLPPLYNRTVYIKPSYYDKLSLNLFMLVLTSNAVTSERVDEDYMFHPRNRKQLDMLISNLRQSTFHWVGFTAAHVEETMRVSNGYLDKNIDTISDSDGALLTQAIQSGERVLGDSGWLAFSTVHEIGVYVEGFPSHAAEAWSLTGVGSNPLLLGTVEAREAQKYIARIGRVEDPIEGMVGAGLRAMNEARKRAENEMQSKAERSSNPTASSSTPAGVSEEPRLKASISPSKFSMVSLRKRPRSDSISKDVASKLSRTKILGFTSAKLTYLCSQLLSHPPDTKSLVFYNHNNTGFFLAEALELLSIDFRIYANTLSPARRAQYLQMFNTDKTIKVLLMDIKQASHGLHVAAANRVYFVGPVWDVSTEAQAIKRAHRIGQTKPVYVETLVLEGTIEDRMWRRRKRLSEGDAGQDFGSKKGWLDDEGVVGIIKNERFLPVTDDEAKLFPRLDTDEPLFGRSRAWEDEKEKAQEEEDDDDGNAAGDKESGPQKKPRKGVRFADEQGTTATTTITASNAASLDERVGENSIFGQQERSPLQIPVTVSIEIPDHHRSRDEV